MPRVFWSVVAHCVLLLCGCMPGGGDGTGEPRTGDDANGRAKSPARTRPADDGAFANGTLPGAAASPSPDRAAQLRRGLVAWYEFEETDAGPVQDSSGRGNDAENRNASVNHEGRIGRAYAFGGQDSFVWLPLKGTQADFTWSAWIRSKTGKGAIVGSAPKIWARGGRSFFLRNGKLRMDVCNVGATEAPGKANDDRWHLATLTVKSAAPGGKKAESVFYLDGREVQKRTWEIFRFDGTPFPLRVGYNPKEGGWFEGLIDDVRIYERALGAEDVLALHQLGTNPPPVVALRKDDNWHVSVGSRVPFTATADDPNGSVARVEFFVGGESIGVDETPDDGWTAVWRGARQGAYRVIAEATDDRGARGRSPPAVLTVGSAVSVEAAAMAVEPDVDGAVKLVRSGDMSRALTVVLTIDPASTAREGLDFALARRTVVFGPGETERTVAIRVRADELLENVETVVVSIAPSDAFGPGLSPKAAVTITDPKAVRRLPGADGVLAMKTIGVPEGLAIGFFADEDQVANPVAINFDEQGRLYVAETFRQFHGVDDNRMRQFWIADDVASRRVEDRLKMYRKWAGKIPMTYYSTDAERIRLIEDRDGDGVADRSVVFAGGFNGPLDGTGAGVLPWDGKVYFTCIPHLWKLEDKDGDGTAESRRSIQGGFGVKVSLRGHDMHAPVIGPDGRLYWSIGDRGYRIATREGRTFAAPGSGAVFRCELDGSNVETFHTGLRNPQGIAFDKHGNLFTVDNDQGGQDEDRLVYLVAGGESGWQMGWQFEWRRSLGLTADFDRIPWFAEGLWKTPHRGQPAWVLPAIRYMEGGPCGVAYNPGVSLPEAYRDHFFSVYFRGQAAVSGIEIFSVSARGAWFESKDARPFLQGALLTDVAFGYDGKLYISDWIRGTVGTGAGRIYTVYDPDRVASAVVREVARLFQEGFTHRETGELSRLLAHEDLRVRQKAQFTLAARGAQGTAALTAAAKAGASRLARLHGIWGLWQVGRRAPGALAPLVDLLDDDDGEVRAQAAKVLGDARHAPAAGALVKRLEDENVRVRFFAAVALGRLQHLVAVGPLIEMLRRDDGADPYLRHAGVYGLYLMGDPDAVLPHADDASAAVRLAVLLALRRFRDRRIARYLSDPDPLLAAEAARAIGDLPIPGALPALAKMIHSPAVRKPDPLQGLLYLRAINANFRIGKIDNVRAVSALAANPAADEKVRLEALAVLSEWKQPSPVDRVTGIHRPLPDRGNIPVGKTVAKDIAALLTSADGAVLARATKLAGALRLPVADAELVKQATNEKIDIRARVEALALLTGRKSKALEALVPKLLEDKDVNIRIMALQAKGVFDPPGAIETSRAWLDGRKSIPEKQAVFWVLGNMKDGGAGDLIAAKFDRHFEGKLHKALHLDLLLAAQKRSEPPVIEHVKEYEVSLDPNDKLARFRPTLAGGYWQRGRDLFRGSLKGQCFVCHRVWTEGGDAGPDLTKVGARLKPEQILESLIDPNARIAPGYGTIAIRRTDGTSVSGLLQEENATRVTVKTPDGKTVEVPVDEIESRSQPVSSMPPMGETLDLKEIRDLVQWLSGLR